MDYILEMNEQPCKRLYRSQKQRIMAGVCGGLAEYFNVDATWMRIIFLVLLLFAGATLVVYLVFWLIVPEAPNGVEHDIPHQSDE